nr:unnamed protein product [Digitaria exilis]
MTTARALLGRLRLAPQRLLHDGHPLRSSISAAAAPPQDEGPPGAPSPPSNSRLFVAGLSWSVDERSLTDAFSSFGTVTEVKFGLDLNVSVTNSIVGMYLSFGDIEIGREIFRKIIVRDVVTWTMMMGFLLEQAHASEVISLFVQMRSDAIVPDRVAMVARFELCVQLHGYSYKSVRIMYDKNSGRSRGFGFIHFSNDHEAKCAKDAMDGKA